MRHDKEFQPIDQHDQFERSGKEPRLDKYFRALVKQKASDLHLKNGAPPHIRIRGEMIRTNNPPLTGIEIQEMVQELITPKQWAYLDEHGSIDVAHELAGSDRFRINIFRQRGEPSRGGSGG